MAKRASDFAKDAAAQTKKSVLFTAKRPPYRNGKKNIFDWTFQFKDYGLGKRFTRKPWKYPEPCFWTVTRCEPRANDPLKWYKRAKIWGKLTWRGKEEPHERRIRSPLKRQWIYIPDGEDVPTFQPDPAIAARAFYYTTLKKPSYEYTEEGKDMVFEVTPRGKIELRWHHLYDFKKPKRLAKEAAAAAQAAAEAEAAAAQAAEEGEAAAAANPEAGAKGA